MKTLLIIDGNAILHRAYHALPPLTDKEGNVVNAVYGFFSMLLKVIEDTKSTNLIVCFDRPAPTFRKAMYSGYQADRPDMADDLSTQVSVLHNALDRSHVTIFEKDGFEADDLIGTLAHQAVEEKADVIILSGDRDLLQLVNGHVKVMMPLTGISKMLIHDESSVEEKYGVTPKQFVDYKALIGDASDGYPGVNGIGPKTASALLQKFGTFENLYHSLGDVTPKISEKLAQDAEQAALAKKLAKIVTDAPVHLDLSACDLLHSTKEDFYAAWERLGFASLRKRLETMQVLKSAPKEKEQLGLL